MPPVKFLKRIRQRIFRNSKNNICINFRFLQKIQLRRYKHNVFADVKTMKSSERAYIAATVCLCKLILRKKGENSMNALDNICLSLVIIGALNWGSIGLFGLDLVGYLFGGQLSVASRIVFALVGLAGLWSITMLFKDKVPAGAHE